MHEQTVEIASFLCVRSFDQATAFPSADFVVDFVVQGAAEFVEVLDVVEIFVVVEGTADIVEDAARFTFAEVHCGGCALAQNA